MNYADFKLGYDCNNHCIHCIIANQRENANLIRGNENRSTQECIHELDDIVQQGYDTVVITGGEPTIREDITTIIKYAHNKGLALALQTNGRRLSDPKFAFELAQYTDHFVIALHGSCSSIHDQITQIPGSFDETVQGITNLLELEKAVTLKVVISRVNAMDLKNILSRFGTKGILAINIAFPHACENMIMSYDTIVPRYSEIKNEIESCILFAKDHSLDVSFETILPCALDNQFDLKYFADFSYYNVDSQVRQLDGDSFEWNETRKQIKRKLSFCSKCVFDNICEGYWMEYIILRGSNEFRPIANWEKY